MKNTIYTVEKLANGGMGIVREGGKAVFVPFVIPGEEVAVRMERGSQKTARAVPVKIITPSPHRRMPPCPLFGKCGGCLLQHIAYRRQTKIKREILDETISWIAKTKIESAPTIPSPKHYSYRSRIRLHVVGGKPGFFAAEKKTFIPVKFCHIAHDEINRVIGSLPELIHRESPSEIEIVREDERIVAVLKKGRAQNAYAAAAPARGAEAVEWKPDPEWKNTFSQVNPEQNENLRNMVESAAAQMKPAGVIELYAGNGNLTEKILPLSEWVAAVDSDEDAVNAGMNNLGKFDNLKMHNMEAAEFLGRASEDGMKPDLIVLDPPRTGAREAMPGILKLSPRNVIYVSCDPATLARDVKVLVEGGYSIVSVTPLDMFPQTAHIESVTVLSRAG